VAVRDSKEPEGLKLILGLKEWRTFTGSLKVGVHDR
jgi:hypothetical protein